MAIDLELLQTQEHYRAVEELQKAVWRLEDEEIVPHHILITAQKNGGLVIGAFEELPQRGRRMVGFVFGFVGMTPDGEVKHCSHMMGVAPSHQGQGIGYRLKLVQRDHVLRQGMRLMTWTFNPLESVNANLNFHKLGATCNTYLRDLYGDMRDELNAGLPTDRFQVAWHIASAHVRERLQRDGAGSGPARNPSLATLLSHGVRVVNRFPPGDSPRPPRDVLPLEGDRLLIQIPTRFQSIRSADLGLACAWREQTRALFEAAFEGGYTVVDFLFQEGRGCYLLARGEGVA